MKKGISPLIATVLIIGFTIGVAMLIFTWSDVFTRELTEDTSKGATQQIGVLSDVNFEVESISFSDGNINLKLKNKKPGLVDEFSVRIVRTNGVVDVIDVFESLEGYAIKEVSAPYSYFDIESVEVIPKVLIDGELIIGSNVKEGLEVSEEMLSGGVVSSAVFYTDFESNPPVDLSVNNIGLLSYTAEFRVGEGYKGSNTYYFDPGYIYFNDDPSLHIPDTLTISYRIKLNSYLDGYALHPIYRYLTTTNANYINYLFGNYVNPNTGLSNNAGGLTGLYGTRDGVWGTLTGNYYRIPLNSWKHIVFSYDSNKGGRYYVDGELLAALAVSGSLSLPDAVLRIGNGKLDGLMDDVAIYDRVLSDEEVRILYNS